MELHPTIQELIRTKCYAELNAQERAGLPPDLHQETYEQYRLVLLTAQAWQATAPPLPPHLDDSLMQAFDRYYPPQVTPTHWLRKALQHRSPSWLVAGLAATVCLLLLHIFSVDPPQVPAVVQVVYRTDTVYVAPPVLAQLPPPTSDKAVARDIKVKPTPIPPVPLAIRQEEFPALPAIAPGEKGSSLQQDPTLLELVVKVY